MYIVGVAEENSSSGDEILIVGVVGVLFLSFSFFFFE